jgi:hypothetical protein
MTVQSQSYVLQAESTLSVEGLHGMEKEREDSMISLKILSTFCHSQNWERQDLFGGGRQIFGRGVYRRFSISTQV